VPHRTAPPDAPSPAPILPAIGLDVAFRLAARTPDPIRSAAGALAALVDFLTSPARRSGLRRNLEAIGAWGHPLLASEPARRRAERAIFRSYHEGVLDYLAHDRFRDAAVERVRFLGAERLYRAIAPGRGAVVTAPHLGSWELAGICLARRGFPLHVVTGIQYHALLSPAVLAAKREERIDVSTPAEGFLPLLRTLRSGGLVILLADGDVFRRGVEVRFFGKHVRFPAGPALLARRAGAPLVHAYAIREANGAHRVVFESTDYPERGTPVDADVRRLTQGVANAVERAVAAFPTQWCIFRNLFDPPEEARGRATAARGGREDAA
jgi:KDO2-lipid IV(A) lauroyltransferase